MGSLNDNIPIASASLGYLVGFAMDQAGNLYTADNETNSTRKIASGVINTVAATGHGFRRRLAPSEDAESDVAARCALARAQDQVFLRVVEDRGAGGPR